MRVEKANRAKRGNKGLKVLLAEINAETAV